jgi:MoxR-like ATPase
MWGSARERQHVHGRPPERRYVGPVGSARREIVLTEEFRHALALLAEGEHLFLTGKAGTGKSTLIRRFMAETERNVMVVAPTGIAALNVDGYTIHRLFGFRSTTTLDDVRGGGYRPGAVHEDPGVAGHVDHR